MVKRRIEKWRTTSEVTCEKSVTRVVPRNIFIKNEDDKSTIFLPLFSIFTFCLLSHKWKRNLEDCSTGSYKDRRAMDKKWREEFEVSNMNKPLSSR